MACLKGALHKKSLHIDFSVQPLCSLCLCGVFLLGIHQPPRHREHRDCTEKRAYVTFAAKPPYMSFVLRCRKKLLSTHADEAFDADRSCFRVVRLQQQWIIFKTTDSRADSLPDAGLRPG